MNSEKKYVFICGLHRSGTSIFHEVLKSQKNISGFHNTSSPEDEGQHLQSVFLPAKHYGGPGKFGFKEEAHYTEKSKYVTDDNKQKLMNQWEEYWDKTSPIRIEKSPPNLIRMRFLQEMFPNSYFIVIIRHPIAVSIATQKWSKTSLKELLNHWFTCHNIYLEDAKHINNIIEIKYEELIINPSKTLEKISNFIDSEIVYRNEIKNQNKKYFNRFESKSILNNWRRKKITKQFEEKANQYGYSFVDLEKF